jgi:transcriptional regulator
MAIVTVHKIKIFVLHVEIIVVIQEHASDHCRGKSVWTCLHIYLNPLGHTFKSFMSIEYEFETIL